MLPEADHDRDGDAASWSIDERALVSFAQLLAATPSVSGTEGPAVQAVATEMSRLGFDRVHVDAVGNCVGILGAGDGPRLLIDGHIDSIPLHSQSRWTIDPFGGHIVDARMYGLGICDQKASIAAAVHGAPAAVRRLGSLAGQVAVVASVNEEDIEGAALASVVDSFRPTCAVTSEPSDTRLCIGQRGRAKVEVTITGRACHAGHAALGINAVEALAVLVAGMRDLAHPHHARLGRRDITCIDVASWPYPSVSTVPAQALARFDCRVLPGETPETLLETFRQTAAAAFASWPEQPGVTVALVQADFATWTGTSFSLPEFEPAWWTAEESPLARGAMEALRQVGLDPSPTHYSFCTNGSYLAGRAGVPTIGFGVGEEHIAHQVDEYVTLASLQSGARGYASLICQLVGGQA
jgi:putative selenium metabolism hydrolase